VYTLSVPLRRSSVLALLVALAGCRSAPPPSAGDEARPARPTPGDGVLRAPTGPTATATLAADPCPRSDARFAQPFALVEDEGVQRAPGVFGMPVPFARGAGQRSLAGFHLRSREGERLPFQYEVLSRWGDGPGACDAPIRWAYVWSRAEVPPSGRAYLVLAHEPSEPVPTTAAGVAVESRTEDLRIDTGPARFTLSRRFHGLPAVELRGPDGAWRPSFEAPVAPSVGLRVERSKDLASPLSGPLESLEIERAGPVIVTVAAKGRYAYADGVSPLRYTVRMSFFAGSTAVQIDHTAYHGVVRSDAPDGANNRQLTDRVALRIPLPAGPLSVTARASRQLHTVTPIASVSVQQDKRTPTRHPVVSAVRHGEQDLELGTFADRPLLAARAGDAWVLATIGWMGPRDPQALRVDPEARHLDVELQSEELFVGGARGVWSRAVLVYGRGPAELGAIGDQAYALATRPLVAAPNPAYVNRTGAWSPLPTRSPGGGLGRFDELVDRLHDGTHAALRQLRITGLQIWPDLPRASCTLDGTCEDFTDGYYEGGDNNYWDWSFVELEQFLRTADPAFLHDFALPEAITMAETVSWRPDPDIQARYNFAGFSPCYGGGSGWEGPWMEGLNQRRDKCPGDYSYNRVHKLAYLLSADRRFTDFFEQGADSVARYWPVPPPLRTAEWRELSATRTTYQYLEQLLNAAEFGRIGGDARNRLYRDHAVALFEFMRATSLERGHVCILLGSQVSDPKLLGRCESDQAWMLPGFLEWVARLGSFAGHAPARSWLLDHARTTSRWFADGDGRGAVGGSPDGWHTVYACAAGPSGIRDETCGPVTDIEAGGRFYENGLVAYLAGWGQVLAADPEDPLGICGWLPGALGRALSRLDRSGVNDGVWGKEPAQALHGVTAALGAIEACAR
jgi:hypothetical protein